MFPAPSPAALDLPDAEASRLRLVPQILRVAGGDPAISTQIREMMWIEYCEAGAPLGVSEAAMYVWWDEELACLAA